MILAFVYLLNKVIKQYLQSYIEKKNTLNLHDMISTMAAMVRLLFRGHELKKKNLKHMSCGSHRRSVNFS